MLVTDNVLLLKTRDLLIETGKETVEFNSNNRLTQNSEASNNRQQFDRIYKPTSRRRARVFADAKLEFSKFPIQNFLDDSAGDNGNG